MKKLLIALVALALLYVASPFAALALIMRAAQQSDEQALASRVDFEALRTSLSQQFETRLARPGENVDPAQRMMINTVINGFASPRGVAMLLRNGGRLSLGGQQESGVDASGSEAKPPRASLDDLELRWIFFTRPTRFEVQSRIGDMVLEPRGIWWRLVDWRLPQRDARSGGEAPRTPQL